MAAANRFRDLVNPPTPLEEIFNSMLPAADRCKTAADLGSEELRPFPEDPEIPNEVLRESCFRRDGQCCESTCASTRMRCHNKASKIVSLRRSGRRVIVCDVHYRAMRRAERSSGVFDIESYITAGKRALEPPAAAGASSEERPRKIVRAPRAASAL
jgi:hypothetical protein